MTAIIAKGAPPDLEAIKARIIRTMALFASNDEKAEFYTEVRAQVALRRKELEDDMLFETNLLKAIESDFKAQLEKSKAKRLPAANFDISLEKKFEKEYNAEKLEIELKEIITARELGKIVTREEVVKTNGTEINKLVRAYGDDSDVSKIVERNMKLVEAGTAKLKIEVAE